MTFQKFTKSLLAKIVLFILIYLPATEILAFENLVYTWRGFPNEISLGTKAIEDLKNHSSQIDILASQAYHIDVNGVVFGSINPQIMQIAKNSHIKLMPLVGNGNFDRALTHTFLNDNNAQDRSIEALVNLCKQNNFIGLQVDFEGMSFLDRDAFSHFYQKLSESLHKNGFQISVAIIPALSDSAPDTSYLKGRYIGWSGVYDYKALAKSSDFITLMAYDQHGGITPPGPMAGLSWDETLIQYALKYIPPDKISLGIPWHSGYWYAGKNSSTADSSIHPVSVDLAYPDLLRLIKDNNVKLRWDDEAKVHYAMYLNHYLYEYLFVEDEDSYKAKFDLVNKYHLRGVSNWCLGEEDPKVWDHLKK